MRTVSAMSLGVSAISHGKRVSFDLGRKFIIEKTRYNKNIMRRSEMKRVLAKIKRDGYATARTFIAPDSRQVTEKNLHQVAAAVNRHAYMYEVGENLRFFIGCMGFSPRAIKRLKEWAES